MARIISFSRKWEKLNQPYFTTFRFPRKDRDWEVGETAQVFFKNRSPQREKLGTAQIIDKTKRCMAKIGDTTGEILVTNEEAKADGFKDERGQPAYFNMWEYLWDFYGGERLLNEPINKLTLRWLE